MVRGTHIMPCAGVRPSALPRAVVTVPQAVVGKVRCSGQGKLLHIVGQDARFFMRGAAGILRVFSKDAARWATREPYPPRPHTTYLITRTPTVVHTHRSVHSARARGR